MTHRFFFYISFRYRWKVLKVFQGIETASEWEILTLPSPQSARRRAWANCCLSNPRQLCDWLIWRGSPPPLPDSTVEMTPWESWALQTEALRANLDRSEFGSQSWRTEGTTAHKSKWRGITILAPRTASWMKLLKWRRRAQMRMGKSFGPEVFPSSKAVQVCEYLCKTLLCGYWPNLPLPPSFRNMSSPLGSMSPSTSTQVQARKRRRGVSEFIFLDLVCHRMSHLSDLVSNL